MLLIVRRWLFPVSVSLCLFLLYRIFLDRGDYQPAPIPAYRGLSDGEPRFSWHNRRVHFPLPYLIPLSKGRPKRLPQIQHKFRKESQNELKLRLHRRKQIKDTFVRCWNSYKENAWLRDEVHPLSGANNDYFGGWAATLVDALDTLWIMDLKTEFAEAVIAADGISFANSTHQIVNIFETNIRYLGGFLSAYDLSGDKLLLNKARQVAEMLLVPFDTPNHMPITRWDWYTAAHCIEP